jgi:hypothetical protein
MAKDRSAGVRLEVAEQMGERCWPEAIGPLVELLLDDRDFSEDNFSTPQPFQAKYKVARATAIAIGRYESLPEWAVTGWCHWMLTSTTSLLEPPVRIRRTLPSRCC